jgi:hypothetical protein
MSSIKNMEKAKRFLAVVFASKEDTTRLFDNMSWSVYVSHDFSSKKDFAFVQSHEYNGSPVKLGDGVSILDAVDGLCAVLDDMDICYEIRDEIIITTTAPPDGDYEHNDDNDIQYVITANREIFDNDLENLRRINGIVKNEQP